MQQNLPLYKNDKQYKTTKQYCYIFIKNITILPREEELNKFNFE